MFSKNNFQWNGFYCKRIRESQEGKQCSGFARLDVDQQSHVQGKSQTNIHELYWCGLERRNPKIKKFIIIPFEFAAERWKNYWRRRGIIHGNIT